MSDNMNRRKFLENSLAVVGGAVGTTLVPVSARAGLAFIQRFGYNSGAPVSGTVFLSHCDGVQNSTFVVDEFRNITTTYGGILSTAKSKFGTTSLYMTGATNRVVWPFTTNFDFPGDFTVEGWVYFPTDATSGDRYFVVRSWSGTNFFHTGFSGPGTFYVWMNHTVVFSGSTGKGSDTWFHVAVVRSGSTVTVYIDGTSIGTGTSSANLTSANTTAMSIGDYAFTTACSRSVYFDEIRITKGIARYTSNFTPATAAFGETQIDRSLDAYFGNVTLQARMNNGNGSTTFTNDSVYGSSTLTNSGSTAQSTAVTKYGSSVGYFNGTNQYLAASGSTPLAFGNGDFTVEFWMYSTAGSNAYRRIITSQAGGFTANTFCIRENSSGNLEVYAGASTITNVAFSRNTWIHIAIVRSGSNLVFYKDGTSVATTTISSSFTETNCFIGGYYGTGPSEFFMGYLDDVRITAGLARYTANFTPAQIP